MSERSDILEEAARGLLSASFAPEPDKATPEMIQTYRYWHKRLSECLDGVMDYETAMLAAARVPPEKPDLDPVRLHAEGRSATEYEHGYNDGWNDCRDYMRLGPPSNNQANRTNPRSG